MVPRCPGCLRSDAPHAQALVYPTHLQPLTLLWGPGEMGAMETDLGLQSSFLSQAAWQTGLPLPELWTVLRALLQASASL